MVVPGAHRPRGGGAAGPIRPCSLMGPFIFNIFSNDLLLLLEKKCHVFNYADDPSILCKHRDYDSA